MTMPMAQKITPALDSETHICLVSSRLPRGGLRKGTRIKASDQINVRTDMHPLIGLSHIQMIGHLQHVDARLCASCNQVKKASKRDACAYNSATKPGGVFASSSLLNQTLGSVGERRPLPECSICHSVHTSHAWELTRT